MTVSDGKEASGKAASGKAAGGKGPGGKGLGKRRRSREMAIQMLYQQEMGGSNVEQVFATFDVDDYLNETEVPPAEPEPASAAAGEATAGNPDGATPAGEKPRQKLVKRTPAELQERRLLVRESFDHAKRLVRGTLESQAEIDELIRSHAENWRLERMPPIDRNILRLALYEMLHEASVPKVVIVDEAIELAKKFGSENSGRFVNGLLDGVLRTRGAGKAPSGARPVEEGRRS
jgi:N utilization substance protein B